MSKHENVYAALVAAAAELTAPKKDKTVTVKMKPPATGSYTYSYATLDGIVSMLRPVLTKHGLWFTQTMMDGSMVTTIWHESGTYIASGVNMPPLPPKPQDAGGVITYFKRYSLCAAFGIVAEEDDDAQQASNSWEERRQERQQRKPQQFTPAASRFKAPVGFEQEEQPKSAPPAANGAKPFASGGEAIQAIRSCGTKDALREVQSRLVASGFKGPVADQVRQAFLDHRDGMLAVSQEAEEAS